MKIYLEFTPDDELYSSIKDLIISSDKKQHYLADKPKAESKNEAEVKEEPVEEMPAKETEKPVSLDDIRALMRDNVTSCAAKIRDLVHSYDVDNIKELAGDQDRIESFYRDLQEVVANDQA